MIQVGMNKSDAIILAEEAVQKQLRLKPDQRQWQSRRDW